MSDELREKLRRLIVLHITSSGHTVDELTDAAIALVREEAAKVADATTAYDDNLQKAAGCGTTGQRIAAAIRALKERT